MKNWFKSNRGAVRKGQLIFVVVFCGIWYWLIWDYCELWKAIEVFQKGSDRYVEVESGADRIAQILAFFMTFIWVGILAPLVAAGFGLIVYRITGKIWDVLSNVLDE